LTWTFQEAGSQFQFFTPRSTDVRLKDYGLSPTMEPPPMIVPTLEDLRSMTILISSTQAPRLSPSLPPVVPTPDFVFTTAVPHFSPTPAVPHFSPTVRVSRPSRPSPRTSTSKPSIRFDVTTEAVNEVPDTTQFTFMPTPMPTKQTKRPFTNRLSVFQFEPTPMPKKLRFKPTRGKKGELKTFAKLEQLLTEPDVVNTIQESSNENFAPKFVIDPDMKDNFAIVKVKNHILPETPLEPTPLQPSSALDVKITPVSRVQTTTAPREMVKQLVRNPVRSRGRLVKKVKSRGQINQGVLKNMKDQKSRRRLQFIKRGKSVPKSRAKSRENDISASSIQQTKEPRISISISRSVSQSRSPSLPVARPVAVSPEDLEARRREDEANRRVAELTNNILELKAKLEQLRLELQV
jgi:hypothetical protein